MIIPRSPIEQKGFIEIQRVKARRDKQGRLLSTADEAKIQANIQAMSVNDLEVTYLTPADFETDEHINQVVQYILQKVPRISRPS